MTIEKAYIGIDPGKTGACAMIVPGSTEIQLFDYDGPADSFKNLSEWDNEYMLTVYIEKVHAMPKQGVVSTFNFGVNYGIWQGVIASLGLNLNFVTPQKWQKHFLSSSHEKTTKKKSLDVARRLYPHSRPCLKRQKDHNRADAILIAAYAMLNSKY